MKKLILIFLLTAWSSSKAQTPAYKHMMVDLSYNFYEVCDSANAYFSRIDKDKKGSGYKPYLRWKHENESKYFPSGNRNLDYSMPYNEFKRIENNSNSSNFGTLLFSNSKWNSLGPDTIKQITGHYAAGLGRVEYVEVNRKDSTQYYFGSRSGGLWRTSNDGKTWIHNTDFLPASGVDAIAASPSNFDSVLINVRNAGNGTSFGIYRSANGGQTFSQTNFNPSNLGFGGLGSNFRILVIKYHPRVANLVFIGTDRGIFKSTNNLQSWTRLNNSWNVKDIEFHPTNNNIIYVYENYYWGSNKNKIYKSTDQGASYTALADLTGNNDAQINISVSPVCANCLWLTSDNGIWKSYNTGSSFITTLNPAPSGVSLWYATPNDKDTSKIVSGYVDLFSSKNSGSSFSQITSWYLANSLNGNGTLSENYTNSTRYVHADCNYQTCVNGVFYVCTDGFLCKSTDNGATWTKLNLKSGIRENYNLGTSQSNHNRTICGSQDNGTSIKTENGWIEFYGADGMEGLIHPLNENWMLGSVQYGGRLRTFDGGYNQNGVSQSQNGSGNAGWIAPMVYDPNNHMRIYSFAKNVFRSNDFGSNWTMLGTAATFADATIDYATIAENNSNLIIITKQEKINLSTDGGNNFFDIKGSLPNNWITDVVFDPKDDSTIIVTYDNYQNDGNKIFISSNLGQTWSNITYNLRNMPIKSVIIDHTDSSNIYIGATIGVYRKSKIGTSWQPLGTDFPNVTVNEMEINYGSNTLKAATWGRGLWEYSLFGRNDYPSIVLTNISNPPTYSMPKVSLHQDVTSTIEYNGSLSSVYVKWGKTKNNLNNTIAMSNIGNKTWKTNSQIPSTTIGDVIYFKVYAVGSNNDTTETYKFMYEIKPFEYCAASGESQNGNLFISNLSIGKMSNNGTQNNAYTFYQNKPITVFADSTYSISANFNTGWTDNDFMVWADFNYDADFDLSERVLFDLNTQNSSSGTFKVPANAVEDTVILRARLGYWGDYSSACGTTLGEVEDYPLIIKKVPVINISNKDTFCKNDTVKINYTGSACDSIKWVVSGATNMTVNGNYFNKLLNNGIHQITIQAYKYGTIYRKTFSNWILVNDLPSLNVGTNQNICLGKEVTLNATSNGTFSWNNNITNNVSFKPSTTQTYICSSVLNGCTAKDSVKVTVNLNPTINAGSDKTICLGQSVTLNAISNGTISWNNNIINNVAFQPNNTQLYIATATLNTCESKDSVEIKVNALPVINVGKDSAICLGESIVLNATSDGSISWNNNINNNVAFSPNTTTTYIATAILNNCEIKDSVLVTVKNLPTLNAGNDVEICTGDEVILNATSNGVVNWDNGVQNGIAFYPSTDKTYTATALLNGCTKQDVVDVVVHPLPNKPTISKNGNVLSASSSSKYQWFLNGNLIDGATNQNYTATVNGKYTVKIQDNNDCENESDEFSFEYVNINNKTIQKIQIMPNPAEGLVKIKFNHQLKKLSIKNTLGQTVYTQNIEQLSDLEIDLKGFSKGIYFISFDETEYGVYQLIVQ